MQEQELDIACPICTAEGNVKMIAHVTEIPYFGEHTQVTVFCDKCGWKQADFIPAEGKKSEKWSLEISNDEHLSTRVVRSSSCTVRIPELDLEVNPGSSSTGYVSNIEGVLNRFAEIIDMVTRQTLAEITAHSGSKTELSLGELNQHIIMLAEMKARLFGIGNEGFVPFTLELLDPRGHSQILHEEATERELTDEEVAELPIGPDPAVLEQ